MGLTELRRERQQERNPKWAGGGAPPRVGEIRGTGRWGAWKKVWRELGCWPWSWGGLSLHSQCGGGLRSEARKGDWRSEGKRGK